MAIKVGIDASRTKSGGGNAHLIGIISCIATLPDGIKEVHIWAFDNLLDKLPNPIWLIKHYTASLEKSLLHQLYWQRFFLPREAKKLGIDIMLNTDGSTLNPFSPSITMSRDMLSYEQGVMNKFGFSLARLRLLVIKYLQNYNFRNSEGVIFLTEYASRVIRESCGKVKNYIIIPHGVSSKFRIDGNYSNWDEKKESLLKSVYVSNVAPYKHQTNVALAISKLRDKGHNIEITFVGGGQGKAQKDFEIQMKYLNANSQHKFLQQLDFIEHDLLPQLLKNFDIFIFASSCENMPNTLIEGMCVGLPIASSERGPMPEILKEGGIYFDPENVSTIVTAIEKIIISDSERLKIVKRAKELSNQYTWERCANETYNYIKDIYYKQLNSAKK